MKQENTYREINLEEEKLKEQQYIRARARVKELKEFYSHLAGYILVIGFMAIINFYGDQWEYPWFLWPAAGWGIGLAFHAMSAFQVNPLFNKNWEERKIKEYMEKEDKEYENTQKWV